MPAVTDRGDEIVVVVFKEIAIQQPSDLHSSISNT
jgi:hypothetical protein